MLQRLFNAPFQMAGLAQVAGLRLFKRVSGQDALQNWLRDKELQISFLSQSIQLEEAHKPGLVTATLTASCACVVLFLGWAAVAKLNEVTRAPGEVMVEGAQQTIQHPEGGVVAAISVVEGDMVQEGQALITLAPNGLTEDLERARQRQISLELQKSRLAAFLENDPRDFTAHEGASSAQVTEQEQLLTTMLAAKANERQMLTQQITQRREDIRILLGIQATGMKRMKLMEEGFVSREELSAKGYFPAMQLLQMKGDLLALKGQNEEVTTKLKQARAALTESEEKLQAFEHATQEDIRRQLEGVGMELAQNVEILHKVDARQKNLVLRSPVRGVVKGLATETIGAVVMPGEVMMDIVPLDKPMLVEARVAPQDIGHLQIGQVARVKVSAYDFSRYGEIEGKLDTLSAAAFTGEHGVRYFKAKILLDKPYVGDVPGRYTLTPGMTVMADIVTGQRTILSYLFRPIETAFQLALQEH